MRHSLANALKELANEKLTFWEKAKERVEEIHTKVLGAVYWWEIKGFIKNLPFFLRAAWKFREFDYSYNIELFAASLDRTGDHILRDDRHIGARRTAAKCKLSADMLRKAYLSKDMDKSLEAFLKKHPLGFSRLENGNYRLEERAEKASKMLDVINKRVDALEQNRKKEVWEYLHKNIERFWN